MGGIGIGIQTETKLWDPKDRIHLRLDTFGGTVDSAALETLGDERPGWRVRAGAAAAASRRCGSPISAWTCHGLFDTADAWRTGRQTAYLNSLLFDRPDREYYWREGASLSLTLQPIDRLLVGAEYRLDSYRSLPSLAEPATFFNHDDRFVNPEIQEGDMGSVVLRAELAQRARDTPSRSAGCSGRPRRRSSRRSGAGACAPATSCWRPWRSRAPASARHEG